MPSVVNTIFQWLRTPGRDSIGTPLDQFLRSSGMRKVAVDVGSVATIVAVLTLSAASLGASAGRLFTSTCRPRGRLLRRTETKVGSTLPGRKRTLWPTRSLHGFIDRTPDLSARGAQRRRLRRRRRHLRARVAGGADPLRRLGRRDVRIRPGFP